MKGNLFYSKSTDTQGFPGSSVSKESACKEGDPGLIPGLGRSAGEEIGYSLWYSWVFPGGSAGKESACNVGDLRLIPGWEDPLEKRTAIHSSILAWRIPWGRKESDTTERLWTSLVPQMVKQVPAVKET